MGFELLGLSPITGGGRRHLPMTTIRRCIPALAALMTLAGTGQAHELSCKKTVNGQAVTVIDRFPATLRWDLTVTNIHPRLPSDVLDADDPMLEMFGFKFEPEHFTLGLG